MYALTSNSTIWSTASSSWSVASIRSNYAIDSRCASALPANCPVFNRCSTECSSTARGASISPPQMRSVTLELLCQPDGRIRAVYDETIELAELGQLSIRRASHVEPDADGNWFADLGPVNGPRLGPFSLRSEALSAESAWLTGKLPGLPPTNC